MAEEPPEGGRSEPGKADDRADGRPEPLAELADRVRRQRSQVEDASALEADAEPDPDSHFREVPFDHDAAGHLWASLDEAATSPTAETEGPFDDHVVPKRSYCQSCEHFDEPPAVRCTHPGTTILELVDTDRFRVRNCPVVAERLASDDVRKPERTTGPFDRR